MSQVTETHDLTQEDSREAIVGEAFSTPKAENHRMRTENADPVQFPTLDDPDVDASSKNKRAKVVDDDLESPTLDDPDVDASSKNKQAEVVDDDDDLESYTPLRSRPKDKKKESTQDSQGETSEDLTVSNPATEVDVTTVAIVDVSLQAMRKIRSEGDLRLAGGGVGFKNLGCMWPVKRIYNLTGLSVVTQEDLKQNNFVDEKSLRIKEDVELYARVSGDPKVKWYFYNLKNTKHVAFDDQKERANIDKILKKKINKARQALKEAMDMAQSMIDDFRKHRIDDIPMSESPESVVEPEKPIERAQILSHQLNLNQEAKPVNFEAGMTISVAFPTGTRKEKIVEIRKDEYLGYRIILEISAGLVDGLLVGAVNDIKFTLK